MMLRTGIRGKRTVHPLLPSRAAWRRTPGAKGFDDMGTFVEIPLVNLIRPRVRAWREHAETPYAGVTGTTQHLLEQFFFNNIHHFVVCINTFFTKLCKTTTDQICA